MKVKARRVGNSLTVTIPSQVAMELGITEDTDMDVFVAEDRVVMEPAVSRWDRLVSQVRETAAERGVTEQDVIEALAETRGRTPRERSV